MNYRTADTNAKSFEGGNQRIKMTEILENESINRKLHNILYEFVVLFVIWLFV